MDPQLEPPNSTGQRTGTIETQSDLNGNHQSTLPIISIPKGGGAIKGIGEQFSFNAITGTASTSVPFPCTQSRSGFTPQISLSYDSGAGNSIFGFGWNVSLPSISRKTDKGLPRYDDAEDSDIFILTGTDELLPILWYDHDGKWVKASDEICRSEDASFLVRKYRPRVEGLLSRIERWTNSSSNEIFWKITSKDNVVSIFGNDNDSKIVDPENPLRVFSWLLSHSYDGKGNIMKYEYKAENLDGVDVTKSYEWLRTKNSRSANRYPKRIKYGNKTSQLAENFNLELEQWMFEVVFDYGDHNTEAPSISENRHWDSRSDPFSTFRPTFELRTYRLCQRILMFHHFPEEHDVGKNCLVSSLDLKYSDTREEGFSTVAGDSIASFISSMSHTAYLRQNDSYLQDSLPPLEFQYTRAKICSMVKDIDPASLENLPSGLQDTSYQFLDLDGEGVSGILSREGGGFFYKSNLGNGQFSPTQSISPIPSLFDAPNSSQQWLDLGGDGNKSLVQFDGLTPGYYKRNLNIPGNWEGFKTFSSVPIVNFGNANLKFVDLRGTGLADILIADEEIFTYYPACAEDSFGNAGYWRPPLDEDAGPRLVFSNGEGDIYLADFTGDGLSDIVRIRNGEVCYWPNRGYGQFGSKITMANSPWFDNSDQFSQKRLRLGDIDGSGTTDVVYLSGYGADVYLNQSGNSWSDRQPIHGFPVYTEIANVQLVDLLGAGTSCLVWSSSSPADLGQQMRFINLLSDGKPHLLTSIINNMGSEIRIKYETSTKYYLDDKESGRPWATKLPFPVQVVSEIETLDRINGNRFLSRHAYHEGYYDGFEREFRGFGFVESWDTENFAIYDHTDLKMPPNSKATNFDPTFTAPPVLTKTWYHTGAYFENMTIMSHFRSRFYEEPGLNSTEKYVLLLQETQVPISIRKGNDWLPHELSREEQRESYRALRGSIIREETFSMDGTSLEAHPYLVKQYNYTIDMLQSRGPNRYAMFFTHPKESVQSTYERSLSIVSGRQVADPRVSHTLNLSTDEYGNVLESVLISYGRRHNENGRFLDEEDQAKQNKMLAVLTLQSFTNSVQELDSYRTPLIFEKQVFELLNIQNFLRSTGVPFARADELRAIVSSMATGGHNIPFQDFLGTGACSDHVYQRRLSRMRTIYRSDDLSHHLPPGHLESLALPYEMYSQVLTRTLAEETYIGANRLTDQGILLDALQRQGRYLDLEGDKNWWSSTGKVFYSPSSNDSSKEELAFAREHFYLPTRYRDPFYSPDFNTESFAAYDKYDLLVVETRDAVGNRTTVGTRTKGLDSLIQPDGYDYRLLAPILSMDPNYNRTVLAYDILGHVTAIAVKGKAGQREGDTLSGYTVDMSQPDIIAYFSNPLVHAEKVLGNATSRSVYDAWAYHRTKSEPTSLPIMSATLSRDMHVSSLLSGQKAKIQQKFLYSDGFGRSIQTKTLAEHETSGQPRWISSGWQIFNNKGSVVRKYEPFFTGTNSYESNLRAGVSSTLFYDPLQRVIAKLSPNHTWQKTRFNAWYQESWDQNDTILINPAKDSDVSGYFRRLPKIDYLPTWFEARIEGKLGLQEQLAASRTVIHANTPNRSFFDPLGRSIVAVSHNALQRTGHSRAEEFFTSRTLLDISGNVRSYTDYLGRIVETSSYNMLNKVIQKSSMESGERWSLSSILGKQIFSWNSRGYQFRTTYDQIQRPSNTWVQQSSSKDHLVSRNVYGESRENPEAFNLRTKLVKSFDQSTVKSFASYDFQGNLTSVSTQYLKDFSSLFDWSHPGIVGLETEVFNMSTSYDALNRPILETHPDGSITRKFYNIISQVQRIDVKTGPSDDWKTVLADEQFNARGQCILSRQGNGSKTSYEYDSLTFNLKRILTHEPANTISVIQDLEYTYDPMKNITQTRDNAQQTLFFKNQVVEPRSSYTYDALYRLIEATGREHLGQSSVSTPYSPLEHGQTGHHNPSNGKAMGNYTETYFLDAVGNMLRIQHIASDLAQGSWSRRYKYTEPSQIQPNFFSNRLTSTSVGNKTEHYKYEGNPGLNGNVTAMAHLSALKWDFRDHLQSTASQTAHSGTPETTWYSYSDDGSRTRKLTNRFVTDGKIPPRKSQRLYLGIFEIYREYDRDGLEITLERKTLHVTNESRRIALIDTQTLGEIEGTRELIRYQYTDNLNSSVLELDEDCNLISYEEYYPYGSTSYQAVKSKLSNPKRYRYTGKERDEESGFDYHGARYYAPWIARWISPDPIGGADDTDLYVYVKCNPIKETDPTGTTGEVKNTWGNGPDPAPAPEPASPAPKVADPPITLAYPEPKDTTADDTKKVLHFESDDDPDLFFKPIDNIYSRIFSIGKYIKVVPNPLAPPIVNQSDNPYPNAGTTTNNPIDPFPGPDGDHFNSNDPNAPVPNGGPVPNTFLTLSLSWRDAPPPLPKKDDPVNKPKQFPLGEVYSNDTPSVSTDPVEALDWGDGSHQIPDSRRDMIEKNIDNEKLWSASQPSAITGAVTAPKTTFPSSPVQLNVPPPTYFTPQPILIPVPKLQLNNLPSPPRF